MFLWRTLACLFFFWKNESYFPFGFFLFFFCLLILWFIYLLDLLIFLLFFWGGYMYVSIVIREFEWKLCLVTRLLVFFQKNWNFFGFHALKYWHVPMHWRISVSSCLSANCCSALEETNFLIAFFRIAIRECPGSDKFISFLTFNYARVT